MVKCEKCGCAANTDGRDQSEACPSCGAIYAKTRAHMSRGAQLKRLEQRRGGEVKGKQFYLKLVTIAVIVVGIAYIAYVGHSIKSSRPPDQSVAHMETVYNSPFDGSVRQVEKYLKSSLKDPDSLKVEKWGQVRKTATGFSVAVVYRAKNSFGAYVPSGQVFSLSSDGDVVSVEDLR